MSEPAARAISKSLPNTPHAVEVPLPGATEFWRADGTPSAHTLEAWLQAGAHELLTTHQLRIAGVPCRPVEVEAYYFSADVHEDYFAHRQPEQSRFGTWYLHRAGAKGGWRNGSYKGLDLTIGSGFALGGFLLRSVITESGRLISGPSLCVDHILSANGIHSVAQLAQALGDKTVCSPGPIQLERRPSPTALPVYRSARVGLALQPNDVHLHAKYQFVGKRYRFLTEPKLLSKGKPALLLGLHSEGMTESEIVALTGCARSKLASYVQAFRAGASASWGEFLGKGVTVIDHCRLLGLWEKEYGDKSGAA